MNFNFFKLNLFKLLKGVFFSLSVALALLLIFAGAFAIFGASNTVLKITQIVIRLIAVGVCAFFYSDGKNGIVKGAISGMAVFVILTLTFLAISGGTFGGKIWLSFIFSVIFGIIFGIIFANLKKSVNNS